jgi:hypothetical protein
MVGSLLVVIVDGRRIVADSGQAADGVRRRTRAIRKAVGFAHGLRGFGGTVEVCSGEVPSGWYLPSIHREGLAAALAAGDGDDERLGAPPEVTLAGPSRGRLGAHVTLGPGEGQIQGDEPPVDHNGTPPQPKLVSG